MSFETDLHLLRRAEELADQAIKWLQRNHSIEAMDNGSEPIICYDYGESASMLYYTQRLEGSHAKFGHAVMRPGEYRHAQALACDLHVVDGVHWVLCGVSEHPADRTTRLAPHVQTHNMVHEAIHYLDFASSGYKPEPFKPSDNEDMKLRYYNKPHELNAFYHQGLYQFLRDIPRVEALLRRFRSDASGRRRVLVRLLYDDSYWRQDFMVALTRRNRRRLLKRAFVMFASVLPPELMRASSASPIGHLGL